MRVAVQQEFYIRQFEAQFGDIALDLRRGLDKAAVEEEMTFWSRDQVRRDFDGPNIVQVSGDPEWCYRFVPAPAGFICLSEDVVDCKETGHERDSSSQHNRF